MCAPMDQDKLMKIGIALAVVYGVYRFAPKDWIKAAALGVGGTIVANQIPYVKEAMSA